MADELNPIAPSAPVAQPATPIVAAPADQPASSATSAPAFNPQSVEGLGIDLSKFTTPQQVIDAIAAQSRQQQATLRFVQGNMQQPHAPAPTPQAAPEEWTPERHLASKWNLPSRDPQWESMIASGSVVKDDNGRFVPAEGNEWLAASPQLAAMNNYEQQYRTSIQDYLSGNPYAKTYDAIKEPLEKMIAARVADEVKNAREQERSEQFVQSWFKDNDKDLYAGVATDPMTGKQTPVLSPWAKQVESFCNSLVDEAAADGVQAPSKAAQIRLAMQYVPKPAATPTPTAAPAPAPTSWMQDAYSRAGNDANGSPVRLPNGTDRPNLDTFFVDRVRAMNAG